MLTESAVQSTVRRDFGYIGPMYRNNSGACYDERGRMIRYGLGNDSAQLNAEIKSSDLIGITPVFITLDMVGQTLGVFTALECKREDWKFNPVVNKTNRDPAQLKFHEIVRAAGGYAGFINHPSQVMQTIGRF